MDLLDAGFGILGEFVGRTLPPGMIHDLVVDGIIAGVGGVLVFIPQILLLFLFISILEDSGYMSRAAFLLDNLMGRFGLHGKAFLPLMSSFACAIPGIMATRTIENRRDRLATIMIAPFMSCSARLPVYALMIAAFFSGQKVFGFISTGAVLMLLMYALGIAVAVIAAFVFKKTLLKSPPPPFVMELPPYRLPHFGTVLQNMFSRSWLFVKRAGTIILLISIVLWGLMYFPRAGSETAAGANLSLDETATIQLENSYAGSLGRVLEPVIEPLGFDWKIGVAIVASFAAREVLVSTLSIIYNVGDDGDETSPSLVSAIRDSKRADGTKVWTPLTALSLMVFFVLAMQCMSTLAIVRRETNSWGWMFFMFGYMTVLAYVFSFITYQGGRLLGFT
jgi:ferrous iron transport protein B